MRWTVHSQIATVLALLGGVGSAHHSSDDPNSSVSLFRATMSSLRASIQAQPTPNGQSTDDGSHPQVGNGEFNDDDDVASKRAWPDYDLLVDIDNTPAVTSQLTLPVKRFDKRDKASNLPSNPGM